MNMVKATIGLILTLHTSLSFAAYSNPFEQIETLLLPHYSTLKEEGHSISPYHRIKTALTILKRGTQEITTQGHVLSPNTTKDLSLFFYDTQKPHFTVLNTINRTATTLGLVRLAHMLITPLQSEAALEYRQKTIESLAFNNEMFKSLSALIQQFATIEEQLLSLWNPEDRIYSKNMQETFYGGDMKRAIRNKGILEIRNRYSDVIPAISFLISFFMFYFQEKTDEKSSSYWGKYIAPNVKYLPLCGSVISLSNYLNNQKNRRSLIRLARERLQSLVKMRSIIASLSKWTDTYKETLHTTPALSGITSFENKENKSVLSFLRTLDSPSFSVKSGYMKSWIGPVLNAIPTFFEIKDNLAPLLSSIAELDVMLSIAQLYRSHQKTAQKYSFAQYEGVHKGPLLSLHDVWHPTLPPSVAVANNITLGGEFNRRNVILTGPNAAGKSTISKSVMVAAILAQTITIVPAKSATITPFHTLNTYLNIIDDLQSGISQHRAEVRSALSIINTIMALPRNHFSLTIMDEMFRCTDPATGAAAAYGIGKVLGTYENNIAILSTHFAPLTELARYPESSFENYKVTADKNSDGSFTFPYQIVPGINQNVIALDLLAHEGFDQQILQYAYEHLSQLQSISDPSEHTPAMQEFITSLQEKCDIPPTLD